MTPGGPRQDGRANAAASPLPGIAMLSVALVLFPTMDAFAKLLSVDLSPFQIAFLRFVVQTCFIGLALGALRRPLLSGLDRRELGQLAVCGVMLAASTSLFFWGLVTLPLANALAIFFVQPLIVTLLAVLLLGETVGAHRLIAVGIGLVGTLIVIRPSWSAFGLAAVLPACAALTQALMLILIRSMTARIEGLRVQFVSGLFATAALGIGVAVCTLSGVGIASWQPVSGVNVPLILGMGAFATVCQFLVVQAVKRTPTSVLAPFQYLEILSATALGFLVFGDFPDALTLLGTAIILASGLYVFQRERHLLRQAASPIAEPGTFVIKP